MCGIPFFTLDSYLARLVKAGKKVAICEQHSVLYNIQSYSIESK